MPLGQLHHCGVLALALSPQHSDFMGNCVSGIPSHTLWHDLWGKKLSFLLYDPRRAPCPFGVRWGV